MGNIQHRFDKFEVQWLKFSLPVISDQAIIAKIDYWHKSGLKLNKIPQNRRDYLFQNKKEAFNELFDISLCDCFDKGIDRSACRCKLKITLIEWEADVQQKLRIGILSGIDIHETKRIRERALRNETVIRIEEIENELVNEVEIDHGIDTNETIEEPMDEDSTYTCINSVTPDISISRRNVHSFPTLAISADRYRISNRAVAALVNAALEALGILQDDIKLDRFKVARERSKMRSKLIEHNRLMHHKIKCFGFDGSRDTTKVINEVYIRVGPKQEVKERFGVEVEEHIVVIQEPESLYLDNIRPNSGRADDISNELISLIQERNSVTSLIALCCDGAPVNTGKTPV